jgi:tetratricopeptide (TPR) repeat protein
MLFCIAWFIPFFGVIGVFLLARWLRISQSRFHKDYVKDIVFENLVQPMRFNYGIGGLRQRLESKNLSVNTRISALNSINSLGSSAGNHLIRTMLPESQDEIRLLAFYLLSKQEKKFIPKISKALNLLQHESDDASRAELAKNIAIEYWELTYHGLVEENLVNFVLGLALKYALDAKKVLLKDPSLEFLLGRLYLRLKSYESAKDCLLSAISYGAMPSRVIPYLAEAYYYQKNYTAIKSCMKEAAILDLGYVDLITQFWSSHAK